jgi:ABC-type ATPase involved in cell division
MSGVSNRVATALVNCPSILLADEPTGTDTRTSVEIMDLSDLNDKGLTIVLVTFEHMLLSSQNVY